MNVGLSAALTAGCERLCAWSDLLDEINVFPVADADTGRNLKISLSPLIGLDGSMARRRRQLIASATGNSGTIAAAFLSPFLEKIAESPLSHAVSAGRSAAWQAVADPKPGTMLSVFDELDKAAGSLSGNPEKADIDHIVDVLAEAVGSTVRQLPQLEQAGVVDAGALGMFIFFEGFFRHLIGDTMALEPIGRRFRGSLHVAGAVGPTGYVGYCVNAVLSVPDAAGVPDMTAPLGDSVVALPDGDRVRLHLHTRNREETRDRLQSVGRIIQWKEASMEVEMPKTTTLGATRAVHLMTDAAGSISRSEARELGITLLDSYLVTGDARVPETLFDEKRLYRQISAGHRVTTAQASVFEKYQSYQSVVDRYRQVVYLTVGSVYTGNFNAAERWRNKNGNTDRFMAVDTGAASGRLALIVRMTAHSTRAEKSMNRTADIARQYVDNCDELVFLDQLKHLAAGGRISRSKGFFGDLLGMKPVIRPAKDGAAKVATLRKRKDQLPFALDYLSARFSKNEPLTLLLQYADEESRVRKEILPRFRNHFPRSRILVTRLSLTSGAHMGPGTWAVAYCPEI